MNLAGFDLNLLKVFDALMLEGSTTKAGQRLGLSQPAVSAALGRLRHTLGDELFLRQGQGLTPTDRARQLEEPVREALGRIEALTATGLDWQPATATDRLKISGLDFFTEMLLPDLAARIRTEAPGLRLQYVDLMRDASPERLDHDGIDIGLMPATEVPVWARQEALFRSPFLIVARQGQKRLARARVAEGAVVPLDLYCDLEHVICSPDGHMHGMADAALAKLGRSRRVVMSLPSFDAVTRVVATSEALALIPSQFARSVAGRLKLAVYDCPLPPPTPVISMIWHRRSDANPAHRWLRNCIRDILAPLDPGPGPVPAVPDGGA